MRPYKRHIISTILVCFAIWACTKKVETILSIDYEINESFESEGFVNNALPTTVSITPVQIVEGFDYFIKYEVESGQGFYSNDSGIITPNEFSPLTSLSFIADYIPSTPGEHRVTFTIRDEVAVEKSVTLSYTISNLDLVWTVSSSISDAVTGQSIPISLNFVNNSSDDTASFSRTINITSGSGTLSTGGSTVALGQASGITPGSYDFTAVGSEAGTLTVEFVLEDSNGQRLSDQVSFTITEDDVTPPVITLNGSPEINLTVGDVYTELGANAVDAVDGDVSDDIVIDNSEVDTSVAGTYEVTYTVSDSSDNEAIETRTVIVTDPANASPVASISANPLTGEIPLTVNFDGSGSSDSDGSIATYSWDFGDGSTGTGATTSHEYTVAGNYAAELTVTDNDGASNTTSVTIEVIDPANASPVASISANPLTGEAPLTVNFDGSGSSDSDGSIATYSWDFGDGSTGTGATTSHEYTAADTFTVTLTVTDNNGAIDTETVVIEVTEPVNASPVASISANPLTGEAPLTVDFDGSGSSDSDGSIATYSWDFGDGSTGTGATTSHEYTAADTFTVTLTVTDDDGATDTETVTITVDTGAVVLDPSQDVIGNDTLEETPIDIDVLANDDFNISIDRLEIVVQAVGLDNGTTEIIETGGTKLVRYTPNLNFFGRESFNYRLYDPVTDEESSSATITVNVENVDDPPTAVDDVMNVNEDALTNNTLNLRDNDSDPDNTNNANIRVDDVLAVEPQHGTVTMNLSTATYVPDQDYFGPDSFVYTLRNTVTDLTSTATVTVNVRSVNDRPDLTEDPLLRTVVQGDPLVVNLVANATDIDGPNTLSIESIDTPLDGSITNQTATTITYVSDAGFTGTERLDYTITDGEDTVTGELRITVEASPNQPPTAVDESAVTVEDEAVTVNVLANDTDPDSNPLVISQGTPINGTANVSGGNVTFTPTPGFVGTGFYNYTISDGNGGEDDATLTITVEANEAPVAVISSSVFLNTVTFTGDQSTDDRGIEEYLWDFGDGNTSDEVNPSHTYATYTNRTVTLTVTDEQGKDDVISINVTPRRTHLNRTTGVYTAPAGASVTVTLNAGGSGAGSFTVTATPGGSRTVSFGAASSGSDSFNFSMPSGSGNTTVQFTGTFSSASGSSGGTATIESFSEDFSFSLNLAQGTEFP